LTAAHPKYLWKSIARSSKNRPEYVSDEQMRTRTISGVSL
jgi:hypothetical protein